MSADRFMCFSSTFPELLESIEHRGWRKWLLDIIYSIIYNLVPTILRVLKDTRKDLPAVSWNSAVRRCGIGLEESLTPVLLHHFVSERLTTHLFLYNHTPRILKHKHDCWKLWKCFCRLKREMSLRYGRHTAKMVQDVTSTYIRVSAVLSGKHEVQVKERRKYTYPRSLVRRKQDAE